ncbi:hypothetical protein AGMMS50212_14890 [Spirochaetia bacterium]|nr:hypothetical protein AGMMS50212_14890 [Spirochaetia bacterium]
MKKIWIIIFFCNIHFGIYAGTDNEYLKDYKTPFPSPDIELFVLQLNSTPFNLHGNIDGFLRKIANYIKTSTDDDYDRVKKVHDFVTLYLVYDYEAYKDFSRPLFPKKLPDQSVNSTILSRKAVCSGYAILFMTLCNLIGIECLYVSGYARGGKWNPFRMERQNDKKYSHAWNIVIIKGFSYLVDCTWDSSNFKNRYEKEQYSTEWLFVKPEHFIYSHFPEYSANQLLNHTLTFKEFKNMPYIRPDGIDYVKITKPKLTKIIYANKKKTFNYYLADGDLIKLELCDRYDKKILKSIKVNYMNGFPGKLFFYHQNPGKYLLKIYYYNTTSGNSFYVGCIGYKIGFSGFDNYDVYTAKIDG